MRKTIITITILALLFSVVGTAMLIIVEESSVPAPIEATPQTSR